MAFSAEIKGRKLLITADIMPESSKSGKSTLLFSTHGEVVTPLQYEGQNLIISANVRVPNPNAPKKQSRKAEFVPAAK